MAAQTAEIVTADRVLTGPAGDDIDHGGVLVRDGTIAAVGTHADLTEHAPHATVRQFPGATILPGLIDSHVHLTLDAGADGSEVIRRFRERNQHHLLEDMHTRAAAAQRAGITTLRDVGDTGGLVQQLRTDDAATKRLPRLLTAGAPLTIPGGEAAFFGGAVDGDLATAVADRAQQGVDFLSVMASGGHLSDGGPAPYESQFSREQLTELVEHARAHQLPVTAHAHGAQAIADAVTAGCTVIEHGTWVVGPQQVQYDEKVARSMAEQGIALCMTASVNWRRIVAQMGADRAQDNFYGKLRWLDELGVPELPGTRAGTANAQFNDLVSALQAYEWAGISRASVLEKATSGAASILGLSETTGTLATGLAADLLVVTGDPRADLDALRHVDGVARDGIWQ